MVAKIVLSIFLIFVSSAMAEEKCFDTSKRITIDKGISEHNGLIPSPDQTKLLATDENSNELIVIDLITGEKKTIKKPIGSIAVFNSNNEIIYQERILSGVNDFATFKQKLTTIESTIVDLKSGNSRKVKNVFIDRMSGTVGGTPKVIGNNLYFYNNGKFAFRYHKSFISGDNDEGVVLGNSENAFDIVLKSDNQDQEIRIEDTNGKEVAKFHSASLNEYGHVSDDNSFYYARGFKDNKSFIFKYDLKTKSPSEIQVPEGYYVNYGMSNDPVWKNTKSFNNLNNQMLLSAGSTDKPLATIDLNSGETQYYPNLKITGVSFDEKGNLCGFSENDLNIYKCYDHKGLEVSSDYIGVSEGSFALSFLGEKKSYISIRSFRPDERMATIVIPSKKCITFDETEFLNMRCKYLESKDKDIVPTDFVKLNQALMCEKEFDSSKWQLKSNDFTPSQAKLWLSKFAKPNGFNIDTDLEVLEKILYLNLNEKFPKEFSSAMLGILNSNPSLYSYVINNYPNLKISSDPDLTCLTQNEKQSLKNSISDYLKYFTYLNGKSVDNYEKLLPLLSLFSEKEKEDLADKYADQILNNIGQDYKLNGIFASKLFKFYFNSLKKKFELPYHELTDVTYIRTPEELKLVQLSMSESPGTQKTPSGLFVNEFKNLENSKLLPNVPREVNFEWNASGSIYKAKINVQKVHPKEELIVKSESPDYKKMCNGKCMNGLIIAGSNLGKDLTDSVVRSYIDYYIKEGFEFEAPKKFDNMETYLEDKVSGKNPVHYLVKEAHSDGDEKNLFRMSVKGKVLTATRIKNGFRETIEIAYPAEDHGETKLISNDKFGQWIKEREKKTPEPIVYLNSSCWSATKAINEITSAASPLLINIPTTTSMTVFTNNSNNVMRIVIDGLRNKRTYEDMRKSMVKDPQYSSKKGNVFIFPDEDLYAESISKYIVEPVNVDVEIMTRKGASQAWGHYSIEDQH